MSRILKGLTEAKITDLGPGDEATWPAYSGHPNDPRDPPRRRGRAEPDYDSEPYDPWADHYRKQDAAQKKYKSEVDVQYSDKEGVAPNGKRYNNTFLVRSKTPYQGDNEIYKFNDAHWGAKNIVDTEKKNPEKEGDPYLTLVYYVDNHKHGYWKPWKDEPPISKGVQFEAELMHEGISEQDLADVLFHRLELRYPDIVSRHGHEVVGDAVADVASFHAGAEELGTSDINIMLKQVLQHIERRGLDEAQGDLDPESALHQARKITSQFKYADMHMDIITKIQLLAEKSGVDRTDLEYLIDDVFEKQRALESAIFSLDEPFEEALRKQQWNDEELDEGWKSTLGGAALAGAMALSGGNAAAGDTNTSGPNMSKPAASWAADSDQWKQSGLPDHVKSDHSITRSSDAQRMSDKRMSSVQGPNASGEYLVTIVNKVNGQRQIQKYVTKNPPKELMVQNEEINEDLRKWFKEKWVRFGPDGKIRGDCARGDDSEGKPKCLPQSKAHSLGKKGRASAAARKRREDPNPERSGKAINVATKKKSNEGVAEEQLDELKCWSGYTRVKGVPAGAPGSCKKKTSEDQAPMFTPEEKCPECGGPMFSELLINEKKDACYYKVKSRYKVWPSAYASGALVKCRKKGADSWGTGGKKNEGMVMGVSSDASSAGTRVQGEAANPAQQAAIAIAMKKAGQKPKRESAIMKGLVDETLGTPYPGTYEQETSMIRRKGPERITAMTYENKEGRKK